MVENRLTEIFIIDGRRTAVGKASRSLKSFSADQLMAETIKAVVCKTNIQTEIVDQVIIGNAVSAGIGQNIARQASFLARLPISIPAFTVNSVCGSGLQSVILAAQAIVAEDAHLVFSGAAESASKSPYLIARNTQEEIQQEQLTDSLVCDGLWCHLTNQHMGQLAEVLAEKFCISREAQDQFAFQSHRRAIRAQSKNKFAQEIVSLKVENTRTFDKDERPRKNISLEKLKELPPAFKKEGTVTAGNSSAPADGASCFLLASGKAVQEHKLKPMARLLAYGMVAVEPKMVFTGAAVSIRNCLEKIHMKISDIDLFEICEAFSVQALWTQQELEIPVEKMNVWGGDIAIGHPLGAAGSRTMVTLLHALLDQKKKTGIVSVCFGGGGAITMIVEMV